MTTFLYDSPYTQVCEGLFEYLALHDPQELFTLIRSGTLSDAFLTYAVEWVGKTELKQEALEVLKSVLSHPRAFVREGAVYGLGNMCGWSEAREVLYGQMTIETDPVIRSVIQDMLH